MQLPCLLAFSFRNLSTMLIMFGTVRPVKELLFLSRTAATLADSSSLKL
jgi:hypothetical protein